MPQQTTTWPLATGYMGITNNFDPVSGQTAIFGSRIFSGTVSVVTGSTAVTWVSGDKFSVAWQSPGQIEINSNYLNLSGAPWSCSPGQALSCTSLALASAWSGASGTFAYSATPGEIFGTDMLFYRAATNKWTYGPGWGALSDLCIADSSTYKLPAPRHPIEQMAVDTKRARLYLVGSVNQSCEMNGPLATNGTTTVFDSSAEFVLAGGNWNGIQIEIPEGSGIMYTIDHVVDEHHLVTTAPVPAGSSSARVFPPENSQIAYPEVKFDTWYLTLNADPTTDTWTQVPVSRVPSAILTSAMTYDPDDDVLVLFGYDEGPATDDTWLFCSTDGNALGAFTAAQTAAGCLYPNDWSEVLVAGAPLSVQPPGYTYPGLAYDGNTKNVIQFGGCTGYPPGCPNQTDVWFYSVPSRRWTERNSLNQPPATAMNIAPPAMVLDTSTHNLLYHYLDSPHTADYVYSPTTNTWTVMTSSGVLPIWNPGCTGACNVASGISTVYDPVSNVIIAWNEGNPSTNTLWQGALPGSAPPIPMVTITGPASAASVMGTIPITANASDSVGVTQVQFQLDGANLGSAVTGAGPSYGYSWDTTTASNGSHTLTAIATDAAGTTGSSTGVAVTVTNPAPVISGVSATSIGYANATIVWTTDQASTSEVAYGMTSAYGFTSALNSTMGTSHTVTLVGLAPSTMYHYQALSKNGLTGLSVSGDFTFTTTPATLQPSGVLIVYNANGPDNNHNGIADSLELAQYYAQKRNIPSSNLLGLNITVGSSYGTGQYGTFYNQMVAPIQNALASLGQTNISVILLAGELPTVMNDGSNTAYSVDSALMGINTLGSAANSVITPGGNPYFDPAPGFDTSPNHFSHSLYQYNGTTMYLVNRLGSDSSLRGIDQVDQSLYSDLYLYPQAGYYYGNAYVNSLYGIPFPDPNSGSPYTDAFLSSQTAVQQGFYDSAADADMNIAYAEHYILASGLPLKWENATSSLVIGEAGATFSDGTSALTAPRALFYGGWYNYNQYNNVYQWLPGSFASDLNSSSYFGLQALDHGASAAQYAVSEPGLNGAARPNILYYYMLNGYSFAEASALATPFIGWMVVNEGDPLYSPMRAKTPVVDSQSPVLASGYPTLAVNATTGNVVMGLMVNNSPNPEVVTAQVQYGPTTSYGSVATSTGDGSLVEAPGVFSRTPAVALPWSLDTVYHYRIVLTDPVGNVTTTGDYTNTPSVSITSPTSGTVTGTVSVTANATDLSGITNVQFTLDGINLGAPVSGSGPSYGISWNTTTSINGPHTLAAVAMNSEGNTAASSLSVTVYNAPAPPAISGVSATAITFSAATIVWTTDETSTSQVAYGTTSSYGSMSSFDSTLVTNHSVNLAGLVPGTTYHYQVLSQNGLGTLGSSADFTFATAPALLVVNGNASEVSGVSNGSVVTPTVAPNGFKGSVVVNGTGSVNYTPAENGSGVYFLNCCVNTNNAYYKFTGSTVGNIFNVNQGQASFYLESRYSFAQRVANGTAPRYAFDVRDGNGHQFFFLTQIVNGLLEFDYDVAGTSQFYFVPSGTENAVYGNGVVLQVTLSWNGSTTSLYLNGVLVKSTPYTPVTPNWTASSNFDLGAYEYLTYGGYYGSDDAIAGFTVIGPAVVVPAVSITAPASGGPALVGTAGVSANASDSVGVTQVQFQVDGANLGSAVTGAGPSYGKSWDTTTATNGPHTLTAIATDALGNIGNSSGVSVTVNNPAVAPVISLVSATSIGYSSATIVWTTNEAASSQVAYGTTSGYGSTTLLNTSLVTNHVVNLSGLAASTPYHYQVLSVSGLGAQSSSSDFMFTTAAQPTGPAPLLVVNGNASEVSGVSNGSVVTPTIGPNGFTGSVVVNGTGSVNYTPAENGNGVYFLNCCVNTNNAYYKFTGSTVGNIFNVNQGQVSFYLESRYSFAQRVANGTAPRYAFDVRDGNGHQFFFLTQIVNGLLEFDYEVAGTSQFYFVPSGTENAVYGNGVVLQVTLSWNGSTTSLYLNGVLVKSTPYTPVTPSWTASSNFDLGAYEYLTYGGYYESDDVIAGFTVTGPAVVVPTAAIIAPSSGASLVGMAGVSANASDSVGVTQVQFQVDGANLGSAVTGAGPSYGMSWDTTTATNGPHTLMAIATDALGNIGNSSGVSVTVNNPAVAPVISLVSATSIGYSSATIVWTTNLAANSQVAYGTTSGYGSTTVLNTSLVTNHVVNLSGLAASTPYHYQVLSVSGLGAQSSSSDFMFTTAAQPTGPAPLLVVNGNASEVSGVSNGSVVTPTIAPNGFTGSVVVNGTGSVNYTPAENGNGVYFLNCCVNTNNAYYKFTGSTVGNIFNVNQGQVSFYLESRYSFAQRVANGTAPKYAFDVRDGNGHQFFFLTQIVNGLLEFDYDVAGTSQFYFVPSGTENAVYGNGVVLQVTLSWNGSTTSLYLNGVLVKSTPYTPVTPNWTALSNFDLGAYEYLTYGGYYESDDVIAGFTVYN